MEDGLKNALVYVPNITVYLSLKYLRLSLKW